MLTITWPESSVDMFEECEATTEQTITFLGANVLPEDWAEIDLAENSLTVDSAMETLKSLTSDVLIISTAK